LSEKEILLTGDGVRKLEEELHYLKSRRREIAERIKAALEFGDITENSEYEEAKNEQAFVEGRIITLEKMLRKARIINRDAAAADTVVIGSKVLLRDLKNEREVEFTIVGSAESDPSEFKISNESPVGKAILGHRVGDVVKVKVPAGEMEYQILEIK
jgi:transcription elongation factor GreA